MAVLMFSPDALKSQIAKLTPLIPDGHDNALIGVVDANGVQAMISLKRRIPISPLGIEGELKVSAVMAHDWAGDNRVGGTLIYSWKSK